MAEFPHLKLEKRIDGRYKAKRIRIKKQITPTTEENLKNRGSHGDNLLTSVTELSSIWARNLEERRELGFPPLPDEDIVPIFLQIDLSNFNIESLDGFGIEIIAEEENGYIIGASAENFNGLRRKIENFIAEQGRSKDQAARLWQINTGLQWKVEQILSPEMQEKWDKIADDDILIVDVGIACHHRVSKQPPRKKEDSEGEYLDRVERWRERRARQNEERDRMSLKRQGEFERYITSYNGKLLDSYVDFEDSFSCRIQISGKGLKDIVLNYQYLFEVVEYDPLQITNVSTGEIDSIQPELIPPADGYPKVCVIDSGIQEEHRLLAPAIDSGASKSFIPGDSSTADKAGNGGHGTRVSGAVLYPHIIPRSGSYQLPCFIQNARVLDSIGGSALLPQALFPPKLMEDVVNSFEGTRIFNMSINSYNPCRLNHMSQWASAIDKLMYEQDILFILSAGNLERETNQTTKPGIKDHIIAGRNYPDFLLEGSSRIGNPAQSCFALTVGSVCHDVFDTPLKRSFGERDDPSSFSRTGLGLWDMIKPDVVEYGGDFAIEKNTNPNLSYEASISPELVKSTYGGGKGVGNDTVGTSFAAPKVAYIAAHLQRLFPSESSILYRALIAQSARLPDRIFSNPSIEDIRHYGYGIPDLKRATENSEQRITFIASGKLAAKQADIYSVKIPDLLRSPGQEYNVLIEVTLSFVAKPRRTRRRTQSYLSTWLDWESIKLNEKIDQFTNRVLQISEEEESSTEDQYAIKWMIRERRDWSKIPGLRRQDSTLQKSWCTLESYNLPESFSIAIIGHAGWEPDLQVEIPYSVAISMEVLNENINVYEMVRIENEVEIMVQLSYFSDPLPM